MYRGSVADFLVVLCKPGNLPQMPEKGDYTHLVNFLRLSSMSKVVLFEGCSSRILGGLLCKTSVSGAMSRSRAGDTCCCSYCCRRTENGETWLGPPKHYRKYIATREISTCRGDLSAVFTMCYANAHATILESTGTERARGPWVTGDV